MSIHYCQDGLQILNYWESRLVWRLDWNMYVIHGRKKVRKVRYFHLKNDFHSMQRVEMWIEIPANLILYEEKIQ